MTTVLLPLLVIAFVVFGFAAAWIALRGPR